MCVKISSHFEKFQKFLLVIVTREIIEIWKKKFIKNTVRVKSINSYQINQLKPLEIVFEQLWYHRDRSETFPFGRCSFRGTGRFEFRGQFRKKKKSNSHVREFVCSTIRQNVRVQIAGGYHTVRRSRKNAPFEETAHGFHFEENWKK